MQNAHEKMPPQGIMKGWGKSGIIHVTEQVKHLIIRKDRHSIHSLKSKNLLKIFINMGVAQNHDIIRKETEEMKFLLQLPCCSCFCFVKAKKDKSKEQEAKGDWKMKLSKNHAVMC